MKNHAQLTNLRYGNKRAICEHMSYELRKPKYGQMQHEMSYKTLTLRPGDLFLFFKTYSTFIISA